MDKLHEDCEMLVITPEDINKFHSFVPPVPFVELEQYAKLLYNNFFSHLIDNVTENQ